MYPSADCTGLPIVPSLSTQESIGLRVSPLSPTSYSRQWQSCSLECVEEDREVSFDRAHFAGAFSSQSQADGIAGPFSINNSRNFLDSGALQAATRTGSQGIVRGLTAPSTSSTSAPVSLLQQHSSSPFNLFQSAFTEPNADDLSSTDVGEGRSQRGTQQAAFELQRSASLSRSGTSDLTASLAASALLADCQKQQLQQLQQLGTTSLGYYPTSAGHGGYSYTGSQSWGGPPSRLHRSASATDIYTVPERRVRGGRPSPKAQEGKSHGGLAYASSAGKQEALLSSAFSMGSNNSLSNSQLPLVANMTTVRSSSSLQHNTSLASEGRPSRGTVGRFSITGSMDDAKMHNGNLASFTNEIRVHGGLTRRSSKSSAVDVTSGGGAANGGPPSARSSITNSIGMASTLMPASSFGQANALASSLEFAESLLSSLTRGGSGLAAISDAEDGPWAATFSAAYTPSPPARPETSPVRRGAVVASADGPLVRGGLAPHNSSSGGYAAGPSLLGSGRGSLQGSGSGRASPEAAGPSDALPIAAAAVRVDGGSASSCVTVGATLSAAAAFGLSRGGSSEMGRVGTINTSVESVSLPQVKAIARTPSLGVIYKVQRTTSGITMPHNTSTLVASRGCNDGSGVWSWGSSLEMINAATLAGFGTAASGGTSPLANGPNSYGGHPGFSMQPVSPSTDAAQDRSSATLVPSSPSSLSNSYTRRPSLLEYAETAVGLHQHEQLYQRAQSGSLMSRGSHAGGSGMHSHSTTAGGQALGAHASQGSQSAGGVVVA